VVSSWRSVSQRGRSAERSHDRKNRLSGPHLPPSFLLPPQAKSYIGLAGFFVVWKFFGLGPTAPMSEVRGHGPTL
jgi:hypothetical protein